VTNLIQQATLIWIEGSNVAVFEKQETHRYVEVGCQPLEKTEARFPFVTLNKRKISGAHFHGSG
jgi:hypothetical protein